MHQIAVMSKVYTKIDNFIKISYKYTVDTLKKTQKLLLPFISWKFYTTQKCNKKIIYDKTLYVEGKQFTSAKKILHKRCL